MHKFTPEVIVLDLEGLNKETWDQADSSTAVVESIKQKKKSLVVKAAATHSGLLLNNGTIYSPVEMKKAVDTMTSPYKIPVLRKHDEQEDAIGRIISARYVDTSKAFLKNFPQFAPLVQDSTDPSTTAKLLKDLAIVTKDANNYRGLGYIQIAMEITDKDSQEKFIDGRYATVSAKFAFKKAVCGTCGTSAKKVTTDEGMALICQCHEDSETNVGGPYTPFSLRYREVSETPVPRDLYATVEDMEIVEKDVDLFAVLKDSEDTGAMFVYDLTSSFADSDSSLDGDTVGKHLYLAIKNSEKNTEVVTIEETADSEDNTEAPVEATTVETKNFLELWDSLKEEGKVEEIFNYIEDKENVYYVGSKNTFPATSLLEINKSLELLDQYTPDEYGLYETIKQGLESRKALFPPPPVEEPVVTDSTTTEEVQDNDEVKVFLDSMLTIVDKISVDILEDSHKQVIEKLANNIGINYNNTIDRQKDIIESLKIQLDSEKRVNTKLAEKVNELIKGKVEIEVTAQDSESTVEDSVTEGLLNTNLVVENPVVEVRDHSLADLAETTNDETTTLEDASTKYPILYQQYKAIKARGGKIKAEMYLNNLKTKGIIAKNISFD